MAATETLGATVLDNGNGDSGMPQVAAMAGTVALVRGNADIVRSDHIREMPVPGTLIGAGDVVETGSGAVLGIDFAGQTGLAVGANSTLVVEHLAPANTGSGAPTLLSIPEGSAAFSGGTGTADTVHVETPAGTLSIGHASGCLRTFPDGRIELVLWPHNDGASSELIVTNGAGQFVLNIAFVVFVFDYTTPPKANDLIPLDEFIGGLAAPLAALDAIGFASLEQFAAGLLMEDREEVDDDSGLQLAGLEALPEPISPLAVSPLRFDTHQSPQAWAGFSSLATSDRGTAITFIGPSAGMEGSPAFPRAGRDLPLSAFASLPRQSGDAILDATSRFDRGEGVISPGLGALPQQPSTQGTDIPSFRLTGEGANVPSSESSSEIAGSSGPSGGSLNESTESPDAGSGSGGGSAFRRQLIGTPQDDVFRSAEHDNFQFIERIDGREAFDTILGTDGNDVLDFSTPDAPVLISIERIDGGRGNDVITGSTSADAIHGGKGDDLLFGGDGSDILDGGDGSDTLDGGEDDDILDGNDGDDVLDGGDGNDVLTGNDGNDTLFGRAGDDIFVVRGKTDGTDRLDGGLGRDTIRGIEGDDVFHALDRLANIVSIEVFDGGEGLDMILAGDGDDMLDFSASDVPVLIGIERIEGGGGNDFIIGSADNNAIDGGAGHDTLFGGAGNDILGGGEGNDVLRGGAGSDILTGGRGSDIFVFGRGDGDNLVTDFSGRDILRVEGFILAEVSAVGNGPNSVIAAGASDDRVSITLQGYSVTDPAFNPVAAFEPSSALS